MSTFSRADRRPRRIAPWKRWADRRWLRRALGEVDGDRQMATRAHLGALAATTAVVARIALVENRPSLRLLQIDFDGAAPTLLASVDPGTITGLAALRLPALLLVREVSQRRGTWAIELATLDQSVVLAADEVVVVDDLQEAAAD